MKKTKKEINAKKIIVDTLKRSMTAYNVKRVSCDKTIAQTILTHERLNQSQVIDLCLRANFNVTDTAKALFDHKLCESESLALKRVRRHTDCIDRRTAKRSIVLNELIARYKVINDALAQ